jgi:ribulose-5-phosphate 4-epimerase/fuculose-1-phosphate aldolase
MAMTARTQSEALEDLHTLGAALAGPHWAQGPGGNVSVKTEGGELWVKASGRRLADVASPRGHTKASLELALRAIAGDAKADGELFALEPRPSLETYMHALGPAVVVHTHAAGALLLACAAAGRSHLPEAVTPIEYVRPGRGLAVRIRKVLNPEECVVLLRSHGLVVYAASAARALELTASVDRLGLQVFEPRTTFDEHLSTYRQAPLQRAEGVVACALPDGARPGEAGERYLFPDAVIYATTVRVRDLRDPLAQASEVLSELKRPAVLIDGEGARLAVAPTESKLRDCIEVAAVHDWVAGVLEARGGFEVLDASEPAQLVAMPSERYRMKLGAEV